jgi:hypothetical protein|tara:strand:+ start:1029 stop:1250 length:222 start_codon:yes stop_codon:yes gene_type:complete
MLLADGFEECLVGVGSRCGQPDIAVYDQEKCIQVLMSQGMGHEEALEYFDFNVLGAWVGEETPIFVSEIELDD